jgi:hypothetical protein
VNYVAQRLVRVRSFGLLLSSIALVWLLLAAPQARSADDPAVAITPRVKASAKDPKPVEVRSDRIRVDTTQVQINVTVTDPLNRFVTGLEKEHFRLFEQLGDVNLLPAMIAAWSPDVLFAMFGMYFCTRMRT